MYTFATMWGAACLGSIVGCGVRYTCAASWPLTLLKETNETKLRPLLSAGNRSEVGGGRRVRQ
jgi:hypothetical protein